MARTNDAEMCPGRGRRSLTNDAPPRIATLQGEIVRDDDAIQGRCAFQDFAIPTADQTLLVGGPHVATSCPKAGRNTPAAPQVLEQRLRID
jgi:hypothetical protein